MLTAEEQAELQALREMDAPAPAPSRSPGQFPVQSLLTPEEKAELDAIRSLENPAPVQPPAEEVPSIPKRDVEKFSWSAGMKPGERNARLATGGEAAAYAGAAGNEIGFGYLPQIQARFEQLLPDATGDVDAQLRAEGFQLPERGYVQMRDENIKSAEALAAQYPEQDMAGKVSGILATMQPIAKGAQALGLAGKGVSGFSRLKDAAKVGGAFGATYNPGDVEGVVNPFQFVERAKGAGTGAAMGSAGQGLGEAIGSVGRSIGSTPEALEKLAKIAGFKSLGASTKDFRTSFGKNAPLEIGETLLKEGIVKAGASVDDMLAAVNQKRDEAGKVIGAVYDQTNNFSQNSSTFSSLPKSIQYKLKVTELDGPKMANQAIKRIGKDFKNNLDNSVVKDRVYAITENLSSNKNPSIIDLHEMISNLDDSVDWSKKAMEATVIQDQIRTIRHTLKKNLDNRISAVSKAMGDPAKAQQLKDANKLYGHLSTAKRMATDKISRDNANRWISLTDYIAGGAVGNMVGGDITSPEDMVKKGLIGVAAGFANRGVRKYSMPVVAQSALKLSRALKMPSNFAKYGEPLISAAKNSPQEFQALLQQFSNDPQFQKLSTIGAK